MDGSPSLNPIVHSSNVTRKALLRVISNIHKRQLGEPTMISEAKFDLFTLPYATVQERNFIGTLIVIEFLYQSMI